jgi:hypothetical protein
MGWLQLSQNQLTTFAMKKKSCTHLFHVLSHNLRPTQYCVFTNGKIIVSVFHSERIFKVASNSI